MHTLFKYFLYSWKRTIVVLSPKCSDGEDFHVPESYRPTSVWPLRLFGLISPPVFVLDDSVEWALATSANTSLVRIPARNFFHLLQKFTSVIIKWLNIWGFRIWFNCIWCNYLNSHTYIVYVLIFIGYTSFSRKKNTKKY